MNGSRQSTIGRMRIRRCSRSVIFARKQESRRRSHRFLRRQRASGPGKKAEAKLPLQMAESENISDTGSEFITMINCRPFRPNLRGFYSFFLRPRIARHNEKALKPCSARRTKQDQRSRRASEFSK